MNSYKDEDFVPVVLKSGEVTCPRCAGAGEVTLGRDDEVRECATCQGQGALGEARLIELIAEKIPEYLRANQLNLEIGKISALMSIRNVKDYERQRAAYEACLSALRSKAKPAQTNDAGSEHSTATGDVTYCAIDQKRVVDLATEYKLSENSSLRMFVKAGAPLFLAVRPSLGEDR